MVAGGFIPGYASSGLDVSEESDAAKAAEQAYVGLLDIGLGQYLGLGTEDVFGWSQSLGDMADQLEAEF